MEENKTLPIKKNGGLACGEQKMAVEDFSDKSVSGTWAPGLHVTVVYFLAGGSSGISAWWIGLAGSQASKPRTESISSDICRRFSISRKVSLDTKEKIKTMKKKNPAMK